MNNYQIYDEIGKGRHSLVYKGRKKKSIEYFAIASIEKSQRQRVLTSVQFLRAVSHRNVLRFHNWYETNNHLWVITEYCIGGDLRSVLELDHHLVENSVRVFGCDLVEGLMHIHSKGIIYGDLKPSNILMDATATLRFYDFGLSVSFEQAAPGSRIGTPSYMAPELFQEDGVPSIASDLWALGCVLYELCSGRPPFEGSEIHALIHNIVHEPVRRLESCSAAFNDLIDMLLTKDPFQRATWAEVLASDFWQSRLSSLELADFPSQPAFDRLKAKQSDRPESKEQERRRNEIMRASLNAERNIARSNQLAAGPTAGKGGLHADLEVDFREHTEVDPHDTPLPTSNPPAAASAPSAASGVVASEDPLSHPSDAHIRPLVNNSRIEKYADPKFDRKALSFTALGLAEIKQMATKELETFLSSVYRVLSSSSVEVAEKLNTLAYFEGLCSDAMFANLVINSSVMTLCMKMIQKTPISEKTNPLRASTATIMGLLVRHATFIHPDLAKSPVVSVLCEAYLEETSVKTQRKILACAGELLFYIGTQTPAEREPWSFDYNTVTLVFAKALQHEDDIIKHYSVKAIENLCSISDKSVGRQLFANQGLLDALLWVYSLPLVAPARTEHLRSSAICAAMKLCFAEPTLIPALCTSTIFPLSAIGEVLTTANAKIAQIAITFLNVVLSYLVPVDDSAARKVFPWLPARDFPTKTVQQLNACLSSGGVGGVAKFAAGICQCLEHSTAIVRGKALYTVGLLAYYQGGSLIGQATETKLFPLTEKLMKDKEPYVQQVMKSLISILGQFVCDAVMSLAHKGPRPHTAAGLLAALQVMTSQSFRQHVPINDDFLQNLSICVTRSTTESDSAAQSKPVEDTIQYMVDAVSQETRVFTEHYMTIATVLVTPFGEWVRSDNADTRFAGLQKILALLSPIVQDTQLYNPGASICPVVTAINDFIVSKVVPQIPVLLADGEPIPLYTFKLLSVCCERSPTIVMKLLNQDFVDSLLAFLDPTHRTHSVYSVKMLVRVLQCGGDEMIEYTAGKQIVPLLIQTMHKAMEEEQDLFYDPCFEAIYAVLCSAVNEPSSVAAQQASHFIVQNQLPSLFYPISLARHGSASECAASCVFLLAQLFLEARQAMLDSASLSVLRSILSDVDDATALIALPLVRALHLGITTSQPNDRRLLQQDEPFMMVLQNVSERSTNADLSLHCSEVLSALYS